MKDQTGHQKGCSRHPAAVILKGTDSEGRKGAQVCVCMKRCRSRGCSELPETRGVSHTLLERVTRKHGTDSLAWEYRRVQSVGNAVMGTRAESQHVLGLPVLLLANFTCLSPKPLIQVQVIEIMVGQLLPLAAQIAVGPR